MSLEQHTQTYLKYIDAETQLRKQLKEVRQKLRPARKFFKETMLNENLQQLKVGEKVFSLKKQTTITINKKKIAQSNVLNSKTKDQLMKESTEEVIRIDEK